MASNSKSLVVLTVLLLVIVQTVLGKNVNEEANLEYKTADSAGLKKKSEGADGAQLQSIDKNSSDELDKNAELFWGPWNPNPKPPPIKTTTTTRGPPRICNGLADDKLCWEACASYRKRGGWCKDGYCHCTY